MRETTFPFVWRKVPLIWVWVQQDLKAADLDPQPKKGLVTALPQYLGSWRRWSSWHTLPSFLVALCLAVGALLALGPAATEFLSRGAWQRTSSVPGQEKNGGAKDSSTVSWMALLTRFGIHFRKDFSAIFIHFPSACISKSQLEFESPRARLFLAGSLLLKKKESKFWWCTLKGYHAVHQAPGSLPLAERPSDYFHYFCPSSRQKRGAEREVWSLFPLIFKFIDLLVISPHTTSERRNSTSIPFVSSWAEGSCKAVAKLWNMSTEWWNLPLLHLKYKTHNYRSLLILSNQTDAHWHHAFNVR